MVHNVCLSLLALHSQNVRDLCRVFVVELLAVGCQKSNN